MVESRDIGRGFSGIVGCHPSSIAITSLRVLYIFPHLVLNRFSLFKHQKNNPYSNVCQRPLTIPQFSDLTKILKLVTNLIKYNRAALRSTHYATRLIKWPHLRN